MRVRYTRTSAAECLRIECQSQARTHAPTHTHIHTHARTDARTQLAVIWGGDLWLAALAADGKIRTAHTHTHTEDPVCCVGAECARLVWLVGVSAPGASSTGPGAVRSCVELRVVSWADGTAQQIAARNEDTGRERVIGESSFLVRELVGR